MKNLITDTQKENKDTLLANISAVSIHIFVAILGFVSARGVVLGSLMPFGLVFVGGCTTLFLPSVATGAFLGYFMPAATSGGFKYIAALLAVVAIRLVLSGFNNICERGGFLGAVALVTNAVAGIVTYSGVPLDLLKLIAESIVILGAVLVTHISFVILSKQQSGFSTDELACLICTATITIIGMINFTAFDISVGRVIGIFLIFASARYAGTTISSACGIALTFACGISSSFEAGIGIYAFAGLAAGVFSSLGKYVIAIAGIAMGIIGISLMQFPSGSVLFLSEIFIAAALFLIIPRSLGIYISKFLYRTPNVTAQNNFAKALSLRLGLAGDALSDVSDTVTQVSEELAKINAPDFKTVLGLIEQDACAGCKLRLHCWENKESATLEAIMQMINCLKGGNDFPDLPVLDEFRGRCLRINKMQDSIKHRYCQYASMLSAESRIDEVRQVVSEQFEGISDMLKELSCDLQSGENFNTHAANSCAAALKNIGLSVQECCAKSDKFGRMSIEIKIKCDEQTVFNRMQIMKILSLACERDFDIPNITKLGSFALITINEHPAFRVDVGVEQHGAALGSICGDAYKYFNDGKGHFIMILSDGMGTGGRAAVDGAMASGLMARLIKAGFSYDCSLKIINSSMLFKSSDESLATLDIASIDLFTGDTNLYKAGAAPTLVRKNKHSGRAESKSLPIGILKSVSFDKAAIKLHHGDIVLLVSDGVTFDGTEWIRKELECWGDGGAQDLAEHICDCAKRRYKNARPDDITVLAAILQKNV